MALHEELLAALEELGEKSLKKFQWFLTQEVLDGFPGIPESQLENADRTRTVDTLVQTYKQDGALRVAMEILRKINRNDLVVRLEELSRAGKDRFQKYRSNLNLKCKCIREGLAEQREKRLLCEIYTELHVTEGGGGAVNTEHEVRHIQTASKKPAGAETPIKSSNIFSPPSQKDLPIRTVLTKGVAGIGKTVLMQKFTLDWTEGKANQDIDLAFPLAFRHINLLRSKSYCLVDLIHMCLRDIKGLQKEEIREVFTRLQASENLDYEKSEIRVVFLLDGLDESRLHLDFSKKTQRCEDVTKATTVDVLLSNLIAGELLPSARLWITTRPAAANQIPLKYVDLVTEMRGFTDPQKKEYFRKRFTNKSLASRIISHIKTSRSLHIMCHIPVFCWITATVLEHMLTTDQRGQLPKTLTETYIHFLVFQSIQGNVKYHGRAETDPHWNSENKKIILSLGKLAFQQLEKGNLIFYEADLKECGIDVRAASVCSGVFTQIFREERGPYQSQDKVFCFVHLSIQEFLAALYVFLAYFNSDVNLLAEPQLTSSPPDYTSLCLTLASLVQCLFLNLSELVPDPEPVLYQSAVDKALQSENGHLDLFLRFLLGLSVETNQRLLQGLLTQTGSSVRSRMVEYIKQKTRENLSPERTINLFHCLNELNDHSLVEEIQQYLRSGSLSKETLSPAQWSALVFVLLTSEEELDVFELNKYSASEEGLLRLLPVVKASITVLLRVCELSERSCLALASVLSSTSTTLRELDLSNNDLKDSGVKLLSAGLESPHCKLEKLALSGCLVTEEGCAYLASALRSNPSHLRELDLSYNHPGFSGVNLLSALLEDPNCRLETLSVDCSATCWIKPGLRKYACGLTLDPNTAQRHLSLSEENRTVTWGSEEQPFPDHPERFEHLEQVLCREGLTGSRCYWEVEWRGRGVDLGVTYRGLSRRGRGYDCRLGDNNRSWSLVCHGRFYTARENRHETDIPVNSSGSNRVGVYLDWPGGTLSFYRVCSDTLTLLHTFYSSFTEPLYPGFGVWFRDSSVSLCQG